MARLTTTTRFTNLAQQKEKEQSARLVQLEKQMALINHQNKVLRDNFKKLNRTHEALFLMGATAVAVALLALAITMAPIIEKGLF